LADTLGLGSSSLEWGFKSLLWYFYETISSFKYF
jgi:hypothetical protein